MSFRGSDTGDASSSSSGRATIPPSTITKPTAPIHITAPTTGFRCFNCGESGHRFVECKKGLWRGLFLDVEENIREQEGDVETEPVYDEEERLEGDHVPLLMIHKKCVGYCPGKGVDIKPGTTYSSIEIIEERLEGDTGPVLMIQRSCLTPRGVEDDWLRTNVF